MEQELRLQRLLQVVGKLPGQVGVDVVDAEKRLDTRQAGFRGGDGALGLVHVEVDVFLEMADGRRELAVGVRRARARAGDDERRTCLVDEDRVDLVDDGERMPALDARSGVGDHVVAQVVEAELGVGAVGDIRLVGLLALGGLRTVLDEADLHAEEAVDLAHPLAVALGEVIVDGDDVDTGPREGVEVAREGGHERLALAGLHLCDLPRVQDHAADELDVEVTQPDGALGCLADDGERLGHQLVERLAVGEALAELRRLAAELFIAELRNLVFEIVDFSYPAAEGLDLFARSDGEKFGKKVWHVCYLQRLAWYTRLLYHRACDATVSALWELRFYHQSSTILGSMRRSDGSLTMRLS